MASFVDPDTLKLASIKSAIILLYTFKKPADEALEKLLNQEDYLENLNTIVFNQLLYFLFGLVSPELRTKLLPWPVFNIKTRTQFRKGVFIILNDLREKNPEFPFCKLQDSQLLDPRADNSKVLDLLLSLTQLCMFKLLDDSTILLPPCLDESMSRDQKNDLLEMLTNLKQNKEYSNLNHIVPISHYKESIQNIEKQCTEQKLDNYNLERKIDLMKNSLVSDYFKNTSTNVNNISIDDLFQILENKIQVLKRKMEHIEKSKELSGSLVDKITKLETPLVLNIKDLKNVSGDKFDNLQEYCKCASEKVKMLLKALQEQEPKIDKFCKLSETVKQCIEVQEEQILLLEKNVEDFK